MPFVRYACIGRFKHLQVLALIAPDRLLFFFNLILAW